MTKKLLFVCGILLLAVPVIGQESTDPNEGSQLTYNSAAGAFSFTWYGRIGKNYLIQKTDDLLTWHYLPVVATGPGDTLARGLTFENIDKIFLRLEVLSYDPYTVDADGDGMTDAYEVLDGFNPKVADTLDSDGDGLPDWWEVGIGLDPVVAGVVPPDTTGLLGLTVYSTLE